MGVEYRGLCDGWVVGRGGGVAGCCPPSLGFPVVGRKCASILCSGMSIGVRVEAVGWEGGDNRWWWGYGF